MIDVKERLWEQVIPDNLASLSSPARRQRIDALEGKPESMLGNRVVEPSSVHALSTTAYRAS